MLRKNFIRVASVKVFSHYSVTAAFVKLCLIATDGSGNTIASYRAESKNQKNKVQVRVKSRILTHTNQGTMSS